MSDLNVNFNTFGESDLENLFTKAQEFWNALKTGNNAFWITICGNSGIGKTYLSKSIYDQFKDVYRYFERDNGTTGRHDIGFYSSTKITNLIRAGEFSIIEQVKKEYFTVIDDFLAEHPSDFIASQWYDMLNSRLGKWTILSTNKTMAEINNIDSRIASRIIRGNNQLVVCESKDFSLRKHENNY